jgi:hypothetical protein
MGVVWGGGKYVAHINVAAKCIAVFLALILRFVETDNYAIVERPHSEGCR